ncbi:MAG: hypothetical protein IKK06_06760 [Clostridia bacterium]|nr:hypothetical protein [Clostridia bacterium]MBR4054488.1 hypothetical protein [Clostridia bacterium]
MKKKQFDPTSLTAGILLAVVAAFNIIAMFFLPKTLSSGLSLQRIPTTSFTVGGILLVGVSGVMAVFGENPKKWITMEAVLVALDLFLVTFNLIIQ